MRRLFILTLVFCFSGALVVQAQSMADGSMDSQDGFARAIAVDNDLLYIGETEHLHVPGLVYVFQKDDDEWAELGRIAAQDEEVGTGFGRAIAVSGDRVLVGAPEYEPFGAAYLFERAGDSWNEVSKLTPSDTTQAFGSSVALGDGWLYVGASEEGDGAGRVYAYHEADGSWELRESLQADGIESGDKFGERIAADGYHLLVSAPEKDAGAVFAYRFDADDDTWAELGQLGSQGASDGARLGASLHLHDGQLLAGAPRHGTTGAVLTYAYDEDGDNWESAGVLQAFEGGAPQQFGTAVAYDGTSVWVGAPAADSRVGALYQFTRGEDDASWTSVRKHASPEAEGRPMFGATLAAAGGLAAVGLPGTTGGAGSAAVFEHDEDEWTVTAILEGDADVGLASITGGERTCEEGAIEIFECNNVDLLSFLPIREVGGERTTRMNDVWGWTDPETGREIGLFGRTDGLSFVDVTDPVNPVFLGDLPMTEGARSSSWRDTKVMGNYSFTVSDNAGEHGMQIFDLTQLRDYYDTDEPATFEPTVLYDRINSAHNVHVNEETGYAYIVGASGGGETCGGGLHMVDINDPLNPEFKGCFADERTGRSGTGYTHDVQCVIYEGPDERYQGQEICFGANETAISIADVTDKDNPVALSIGTYPNYGYVHQGWLDEDMRYFYVNDELDELNGLVDNTRTLIWDLQDLEDPQLVEEYFFDTTASTHNIYIKGNTMYLSNYRAGLHVMDISDRENPVEIGQFDTAPFQEGPGFSGSWSNYPFFESGTILVNSIGEGIFMVRPQDAPAL